MSTIKKNKHLLQKVSRCHFSIWLPLYSFNISVRLCLAPCEGDDSSPPTEKVVGRIFFCGGGLVKSLLWEVVSSVPSAYRGGVEKGQDPSIPPGVSGNLATGSGTGGIILAGQCLLTKCGIKGSH